MLKRIFWLALAALAASLAWLWFQQRKNELTYHTPHFAPPRPFDSLGPASIAPQPPVPPPAVAPDSHPTEARDVVAPAPPQAGTSAAPDAPEALEMADRVPGAAEGAASVDEEAEPAPETSSATTADEPLLGKQVIGYCVRCKTKRAIQDAHEETTESGRRAARGTCPVCGANMFTFLKDEAEA
jgi:hypothetical protein